MPDTVSQQEYEKALELWPTEIVKLVRNTAVVPNWLGTSDSNDERFWFRKETVGGHEFILVDASTGNQQAAFDHALVARALNADATALPFSSFLLVENETAIEISHDGETKRIDLTTGALESAGPADITRLKNTNGHAVFVRDHDLWIVDAQEHERQLTNTGQAHFAWGSPQDFRLTKVAESRTPIPLPVHGTSWAPDDIHILTQQLDEREIAPYVYLESVPADGSIRPIVHEVRKTMAGEPDRSVLSWYVINTETGAQIPVIRPDNFGDMNISAQANGGAWWSPDSRTVYVLANSISSDRAALLAINARTGQTRYVHEERADTWFDFNTFEYNSPNVRILHARGEAIWYSQSSGWGHLYLLDLAGGGIKREITSGDWPVFDIISVHETQGFVYFSAGGREPDRHPYYRHLYRVDLDGDGPNAGLQLLTPEDADHGFTGGPTPAIVAALGGTPRRPISPSGHYIVDCYSRVDLAPRTIIRDSRGEKVADLIEADISALEASGWIPPEIFTAKATDGTTDLYGVLIKPRAFDPTRSYPVLERIYGGPQIVAQPRNFPEGINGGFTHALNAMAEMGFVIAVLDGPGTPCRSKAFHDFTWNEADRWGLRHHQAALEGAAATRPWMDLSCVGISGHSFGGYATAMALTQCADFYQVGVSTAGMYDPMWCQKNTPIRHLGRPDFGDGRQVRTRPNEMASNYDKFSPSHYADQLTGRLMLAYGDLDENIEPASLLKFVDSLIRAGKSFDLLYLPGRNHGFVPEPYFQKRLWDYFIEHCQGREPLRHWTMPVEPGQRILL